MYRREFIKGSAIYGMALASSPHILGQSGKYNSNKQRSIHRVLNAKGVNVGTLPVLRAFAGSHLDYVSPFVLFDEFGPIEIQAGSDPLKVEAHPHAGVTPTTYFVEGSGHHKDSLDYDFQIGKGDFMMFSSGKGAIHMEESGDDTVQNGGIIHGFQIWLNTPSKYKFQDPSTNVFNAKNMGVINDKDYSAQIVLGELFGIKSNIELQSPAFYYHIKLKDNGRIDIPTDPNDNAFLYLIKGKLEAENGKEIKENQVVLYERGESLISLFAECEAEFLVLGGKPLNETVYSYGPFVMNNEVQIQQCIRNYQNGLMGDPDLVNL